MAKRRYNNGYASVTGVLGILRKIGLEIWFKQNTAQFCDEKSKRGRLIGTEIHDAIEQFINTGNTQFETAYPEEVGTALSSFALFRQEHPEIKLSISEQALTSEKHKYNGTIDCIGDGILIDWKTGEAKKKDKPTIYDEYKYQVAAYVYLWNEVKEEKIDKACIVAIAKDKVSYNYYEMDKKEIDDCFIYVFLSALKIFNYQKLIKSTAKLLQKLRRYHDQ